jgi:hypothetical protein
VSKQLSALALVMSAGALVLAICLKVFYIDMAGFPDGHLTELERSELVLFKAFAGLALVFSGYCLRCGLSSSRLGVGKRFGIASALFALITLAVIATDYVLRSNLNHGGGG